MRTLTGHISDIGNGLEKASGAYNSAVGSLENRGVRRFRDLGAASSDEISEIEPIDIQPRQITVLELKKDNQ